MSYLYTGVTNNNQIGAFSTTATVIATGTTRWNQTTSCFEMFDGTTWKTVMTGQDETMLEMVQHLEDRLADEIDNTYPNNTALLDAYKEWEEATQRFKVIVALTEKS